ncbi:asparagine synthase (glutamine-hydrolyzing) [Gammaproteobacteria bacterium]|nr:asparagine synthase (glutamine-hydrolyzing) [Gammaproteobacteria bacterium]
MCGIAGWICWEGLNDIQPLERMTAQLAHRGPDNGSVVAKGPIGLGHRRLAVLDLSNAASQPMRDKTGRFIIVFNGEIYNFMQIKSELESLGCSFISSSDTEVVLQAFSKWGESCLERFNGMFAFAIWDMQDHKLFLARDRLGEKPLYYFDAGSKGFLFSSELRSLSTHPWVSSALSTEGLSQFLSLNYTVGSTSLIDGVKKLLPGHAMWVGPGGMINTYKYWDLAKSYTNKTKLQSPEEASERLYELIDDAVKIRMVSDVPLSSFLSGGVDSATIAASMVASNSFADVRTYCMGFREASFSEAPQAKDISAYLGTSHHEFFLNEISEDMMLEAMGAMDEPMADTSFIPLYYLSKYVRRSETVCLSGDGGDEVFGGYETYVADQLHQALRHIPQSFTNIASNVLKNIPVNHNKVSLGYKLRQFLAGQNMPIDQAHYFWRTIFNDIEKETLLTPAYRQAVLNYNPFSIFESFVEEVKDCHYLDRAMYVDTKTWLPDDVLVKVDRATMASSLEARAPFLDHRLVEFCASLPVSWKVNRNNKKKILKLSQVNRLPSKYLTRSKKGFNAPVSMWLNGPLQGLFRDLTSSSELQNYINPRSIDALWKDHLNGVQDNGYKIFGLGCLSYWLASRSAH